MDRQAKPEGLMLCLILCHSCASEKLSDTNHILETTLAESPESLRYSKDVDNCESLFNTKLGTPFEYLVQWRAVMNASTKSFVCVVWPLTLKGLCDWHSRLPSIRGSVAITDWPLNIPCVLPFTELWLNADVGLKLAECPFLGNSAFHCNSVAKRN